MNLNVPHLHLLLNHIPTIGGAAALVLLIIAFVRKSDDLKRIALEATYVVALLTFVVGSFLLRDTHNVLIWDEVKNVSSTKT